MLDVFDTQNTGFTVAEMTMAIQKIPNNYGKIQARGMFPIRGIATTTVQVESRNGVLNVLPTVERGGPPTKGSRGSRDLRSFIIPHVPHDDTIKPEDVQNRRQFGTEDTLETMPEAYARTLQNMRNKHSITLEFMRMGGLKGKVIDGNNTVVYDWFKEFKIQQKKFDFKLGTPTSNVKKTCMNIVRHIETNLKGETMTHVHSYCSSEFFDALTSHDTVKDAYERWENGAALRDDMRGGFPFGGIIFEEYNATVSLTAKGSEGRFIAEGEAHFFPVGTSNTDETIVAPGDFMEAVNTIGQELYARQEILKHGKGIEIYTESNPLVIYKRPELLVKGETSN